ncbi:MAG: ABC-F type ribosomal protection protein [Clostridia bacterium]|jgi:ATP-binding cassette subfamily F protein 3|nr:ABC-F type ribosomal protection protein [Clostridia bacterium]
MNYKITNGAISYGANTILEEINFEIHEKDKIAIVGNNGSGKTTLLKSIIDNEMLEEGIGEEKFEIQKQGKPVIGYLQQIAFENSNHTFLEEIIQVYEPITQLENKISNLQQKLQTQNDDKLIKEYTESLEKYELIGGYTYKKEYETAIKKFGFSQEDKNKKINEFSGGQKTKIAFLKLLLSKPDILLLDEPTNHLDINAIEWLENYLKNYTKAVVIVSHDRMFLDKIVNKVYEIEYATITEYKGNYTAFEKQKRENYEKQLKDYEYQQKEIKRLKAIADRFRYKPTKAKMALSKLKKIEQMAIIEEPNKYDLSTFHTNFNIPVESGNLVLSAKKLQIGYEGKKLSEVSFELYKGQKLAIIGENGKGKSTLLKTLMGYIPKINGEYEYGYHVIKEYFDQQIEFSNPNKTIVDDFSEDFPNLTTTQIRQALGTFLFTQEEVFKEINVLSGGEKVRLQLCKILKKEPNLLLLDEPTNHMDIVGKESLENILKEYNGTLIFVSHDRYFVNKIADSILAFEPEGVIYFKGNYEEYIQYKNSQNDKNIAEEKVIQTKKKNTNNQYLQNKEKLRRENKIKKLEAEIGQKETEIEELKDEMTKEDICTDYIKLKELQDAITSIEQEIEAKMLEWEEYIEN